MTLNDFVSIFGKDNIFKWIFELPNFYIRPTRYFRDFFQKSNEEKFSASFFYTALAVILLYIFKDNSFREITRGIIIEIAILIFAFILLTINRLLLDKLFKTTTKPSNIAYFLWITKILSLPLQLTFYVMFNKTEMYEFLFIHNVIIVLVIIFVIVYSNKIFYISLRQIMAGIIVSIILYNSFIISIKYLRFDKHEFEIESTIFTDNIYKEFETKIQPLDSLTNKVPIQKFLIKVRDNYYLTYTFEKDSIPSVIKKLNEILNDSYSFDNSVIAKLDKNKITQDRLKYRRNKELYSHLMKYLNTLKYDITNPLDTTYTYIIDKKVVCFSDGEYYGEVKHLTTNTALINNYLEYINVRNDFFKASNIAEYPLYILSIILFPASLLIE